MIDKGVFLFGAGSNGIWCLDYLKRIKIKVMGFIDNNPVLRGRVLCGKKIISYNDYEKNYNGYGVMVTAKHVAGEIIKGLRQDVPAISFDAWFAIKNKDFYDEISFVDLESVQTLDALRQCMMESDARYLTGHIFSNQYFEVGPFSNGLNETFIDCGAYVGDTLEQFIQKQCGVFEKIIAFEPGIRQYNALVTRKKRLIKEWALNDDAIITVYGGVGEKTRRLSVNEMEKGTSLQLKDNSDPNEGDASIDVYKIDDFVAERNIKTVTWIKSDIEGMEIEMLKGAEATIRAYRPKFTICVYHKPDDLFRIYKYLLTIHQDYKFALRHHSPRLMETVLYAW